MITGLLKKFFLFQVAEKKFGIDKMVLKLLLVCLLNRIAVAEDSNATESKESIRFDDPNLVNPPTDRQGKFLSLASTGNTDVSWAMEE